MATYGAPISLSTENVMKEFSSMVLAELQNTEMLRGICREYDSHGGHLGIPLFDAVNLTKVGFDSGDLQAYDASQREVVLTQDNYSLKLLVSRGGQTLFNFSVIQAYAQQLAMGIGRFNDAIKLRALDAATATSSSDGYSDSKTQIHMVTSTAGLQIADLVKAKSLLMRAGCGCDRVAIITDAANLPGLYSDQRFTSWDYNSARPITKAHVGNILGMPIFVVGQNPGKVIDGDTDPKAQLAQANSRLRTYVVDYDSLAVAYNRRPSVQMHDESWNDRISALATATAASMVIRGQGVVRIESTAQ